VLILLAGLAAWGAVRSFQAGRPGLGLDSLAVAACSVAVVVAFTWRVQCSVITSRRRECRNDAYGVLFGCGATGHKLGKFRTRLGLRQEPAPIPAVARQHTATAHQWASDEVLPIVIAVAGGGIGICAFWFGLISTAAGVASVALAAVQLH
jgi:hypothetical protein